MVAGVDVGDRLRLMSPKPSTGSTGPKISSLIAAASGFTPVSTVGAT